MDVPRQKFFDSHPDPMWIYDIESLRFLDVNNAAVAKYGYSRAEFLAMTIADIRPAEDLPALATNVRTVKSGLDEAGIWRHRLRTGEISRAVGNSGILRDAVGPSWSRHPGARGVIGRDGYRHDGSEQNTADLKDMFEALRRI